MVFFDAAPADGAAADGFLHRAEQNDVHQLAIVETLEKNWNEQRPVFVWLEQKRDRACENVDDQEAEEEEHGALDVGRRPNLREMRDFLPERPQQQRAEEHQVDDRRNQRQGKLEDENIGQRNPAERSEFRSEQRVAVLPERLQRAKRPAEALANELARGFGSFRPSDGFFVVADAPAEAAERDGEVGVFGDSVGGDAPCRRDRFFAPRAERAGNNRNAIQQIKSALLHVLAGDVFERLPTREPTRPVADLDVAGDSTEFRVRKMPHQLADRVGLDLGVGVDGDDDFRVRLSHRVAERRRFAAIDLMDDVHSRLAAEILVEQFTSAIGRAIVDNNNLQIGKIGCEDRCDRLQDDGFLVVRRHQDGHARRRNQRHEMVGAQFFDEREEADDERPAADQHDTDDEDRRDSRAQPAIDSEDEAIGARLPALHRGERHHYFGARLADQVGDGNKLVTLDAQRVDDFRQSLHGVIALAAAVVEQDDVAVFGLAHDIVDDFLLGNLAATGELLPIVRVDFLTDDEVAHVLRDRKLRDFFGIFGLVVDAVWRAEKDRFHADRALDQALCQV